MITTTETRRSRILAGARQAAAAIAAVLVQGLGAQKKKLLPKTFELSLSRTEVRLLAAAVLPCVNFNFANIGTPDERMMLKTKLNLAMRRVLETIE